MNSRPLMTVRIAAAPPQKLYTVPHGIRSIVPVTGGDFDGPRLRGQILPGGGDWLLQRSDGVLELDLRITLETDDHALIYMTFQGLRHGPPDVIAALARGDQLQIHGLNVNAAKPSIPLATTFAPCRGSRPRRKNTHS